MTIHHHIGVPTLAAYAAGHLDEALSLAVATHLSLCPVCQRELALMENLGGVMLDDSPVVALAPDSWESVLAQLEGPVHRDLPQTAKPAPGKIPQPLRGCLPGDLVGLDWKTVVPGIKVFDIPDVKQDRATARLLSIAPGMTIPDHGHSGSELTLVLSGSFSDEIGRFMPGDIADLDEEIEHQPIADTNENCICLIVTEGPLKFKNVVPKIVQYFTGF